MRHLASFLVMSALTATLVAFSVSRWDNVLYPLPISAVVLAGLAWMLGKGPRAHTIMAGLSGMVLGIFIGDFVAVGPGHYEWIFFHAG